EESVVACAVAGYLIAHRRQFRARSDVESARIALRAVPLGAAVVVATATMVVELAHGHRPRPPVARGLVAVLERLVGMHGIAIVDTTDDVLAPVLLAVTFGLVLAVG